VHFICSDGVGGYGSVRIRIVVEDAPALPEGWQSAPIGLPEVLGSVGYSEEDSTFAMVGNGLIGETVGRMVFQRPEGDADLIARITPPVAAFVPPERSRYGLMFRPTLRDISRGLYLYLESGFDGPAKSELRINEHKGPPTFTGAESLAIESAQQRIIRRGDHVASYHAGEDGEVWEQLHTRRFVFDAPPYLGFGITHTDYVYGDEVVTASARFALQPSPAMSIPLIRFNRGFCSWPEVAPCFDDADCEGEARCRETAPQSEGEVYEGWVAFKLMGPAGAELRYTIDGEAPTREDALFDPEEPPEIRELGQYTIRARAWLGDEPGAVSAVVVTVASCDDDEDNDGDSGCDGQDPSCAGFEQCPP
jgi:hypothetical protein